MKTVKAKIELSEDEIRVVLAEYLGVKPSDVRFNVTKLKSENESLKAELGAAQQAINSMKSKLRAAGLYHD